MKIWSRKSILMDLIMMKNLSNKILSYIKRQTVFSSPLYGLFLFFHHVSQLLKYGAKLHNGGLYILHSVCTVLNVWILNRHMSTTWISLPAAVPLHHTRWTNNTLSLINCICWLELRSISIDISVFLVSSCIRTELSVKREERGKNNYMNV